MNVPLAPLLIIAWSTALAAVDDDPTHGDPQNNLPSDCKYVFQELGIFLAANPLL